MYTPTHFREDRLDVLHALMRAEPFATVVTAMDGVPEATHLPLLLDASRGPYGALRGHMARANPQWRAFDGERQALVIFQGPHAYISPSWYATSPSAPTWNYLVAHAYGRPRVIEDAEEVLRLLTQTVATFETPFERPWSADSLPEGYIAGLAKGVVAFEMVIERIEGKAKLSQNRPADREGVIAALESGGTAMGTGVAGEMRNRPLGA